MVRKSQSSGNCELCGKSFTKPGMARHLQSCLKRGGWPDSTARTSRGQPQSVDGIHISITDAYRPEYWLHLAVPSDAKLIDLDDYLRAIWVECCGHLSAFDIGGVEYESHPEFGGGPGMGAELDRVARPGTAFRYEYDFGTTTHLTLRSVDRLSMPAGSIRLMARNDPPEISCTTCGEPAAHVGLDPEEWMIMTAGYCDKCAPTDGDEADYLLPVVNSPRCGMCGYEGPWHDE